VRTVEYDKNPDIFPKIKNWKISEEIQTFNPENLFNYINGAADLYLIYDFQELKVATYIAIDGGEEPPEIDVEVYDQKNSENAYGMYSQERPSKPEFLNIGAQAYKEGSILNFISGKYYIKIDSHDNSEKTRQTIYSIAEQLSNNLSNSSSLPEMLNVFPDEGKVPSSDMFISKDFLGHRFLTDVYRFDYKASDSEFTLFLIKKENKNECEEIINKYHEFCKKSIEKIVEGEYKLSDRYNGEIYLVWKSNFIWGILTKEKLHSDLSGVKHIEKKLKDLNLIN